MPSNTLAARLRPIVLLLLALTACTRVIEPAPDEQLATGPVEMRRLDPEPYSFAYYSGFRERARIVVRDEVAWRAVWRTLWEGHSPVPAVPEVDFGREVVVVAAMGQRASGGYSILLESAQAEGGDVVVTVRSESPGASCGVTGALTQPVDVAILPRSGGAVRFGEVSEVKDCG